MGFLATSLKSSAVILAIGVVIYYVVSTYLTYRKLAHIKGPWLACISPLWLFYQTIRGRVNVAGEEVLRKYGSPIPRNILPLTESPNLLQARLLALDRR
jgi:hypothetical protein